jgi:hypothetical protein
MDFFADPLIFLGRHLRLELHNISLAMVATLLMIFGTPVLRSLRKYTKSYPFLVRTAILMTVSSFGMAFICSYGTGFLASQLATLNNAALFLFVFLIFFGIGWLAQKDRLL